MTKSTKLTAAELKDLQAAGYVEGQPATIPENVSPVLKAKIIDQWATDNDITNPAFELPDATSRQNAMARERAAAEEDGEGTSVRRQSEVNK